MGWRLSHNFREWCSWNNLRIACKDFRRTKRLNYRIFNDKNFFLEIDWDRFVSDAKDFGAQVLNGIRDFGADN